MWYVNLSSSLSFPVEMLLYALFSQLLVLKGFTDLKSVDFTKRFNIKTHHSLGNQKYLFV